MINGMCGSYIFCKLLKLNELSLFGKWRMLNFVESNYQLISAGAYFFKVTMEAPEYCVKSVQSEQ